MSSNAPHIDDLEEYKLHYILGVKEGDHTFLFQHVAQAVEQGEAVELTIEDDKNTAITHSFRIVYRAPLNKSHQKKLVTFVEYWELNNKTGKKNSISAGLRIWRSPGRMSASLCAAPAPTGK
jgi:hypothetical protein